MCIYVRGLDSFEKKSTRKCLLISLVFEKMEYLVLLQNGFVNYCFLLEAYYIHVGLREDGEGTNESIGHWCCRHASST